MQRSPRGRGRKSGRTVDHDEGYAKVSKTQEASRVTR